ncbi:hypothetical protein CR513_36734, partial [Mucuna pruriens]
MHRSMSKNIQSRFLSHQMETQVVTKRVIMDPCDVFISYRCLDTKTTVAAPIYDHLRRLDIYRVSPFLGQQDYEAGGILECKIGLAVMSRRYCESYFCLHELALLMECRKKVIPIFVDIKPSQLRLITNKKWTLQDHHRFKFAVEEAKNTVGLTFNSSQGNITGIVTSATDIIIESMTELEHEEAQMQHSYLPIS